MAERLPVLVVAHQAPPLIGPGVERVASWMRWWPRMGVEPVLLCAPAGDAARFHGYAAPAGAEAASLDPRVRRVATPPPRGLAGLLLALGAPRRLAWTLSPRALREPEAPWERAAAAAGEALARETGCRLVVSSSQPYAAHGAARRIARALSLPWVADFRDPMTEAPGRSWPTKGAFRREVAEEASWMRDATLVWANTDGAARRLRERFAAAAAKVVVRRNAVEAEDLPPPAPPPPFPPLRIGHLGRFTEKAPSGRLAHLDHRPQGPVRGRSPAPLFEALAALLAAVPAARGAVTFVTVGDPGGTPPPGVLAEPHGAVPHREALAVAAGCHALYLPLTAPGPAGPLFVPQKAYEYAALGRPVLVSGTRRETTDLLGPLALVAEPGDGAAMLGHLRALWDGLALAPARPAAVPTREEVARLCADDLRSLA